MALLGRRGGQRARHLEHHGLALQPSARLLCEGGGIAAHAPSGLLVVAADERRVVLRLGLTVEEHHGNALGPHTGDGRGYGSRLGGCHHQQVGAGGHQRVYLTYLQRGVVAGNSYRHTRIMVVQMLGSQHLTVHLLAPLSRRAL